MTSRVFKFWIRPTLIVIAAAACILAGIALTNRLGSTQRLQLLTNPGRVPIANAQIELTSSKGVACLMSVDSPCPDNRQSQTFNTDREGMIEVPKSLLQEVNHVYVAGEDSDGRKTNEMYAKFDRSGKVLESNVPGIIVFR